MGPKSKRSTREHPEVQGVDLLLHWARLMLQSFAQVAPHDQIQSDYNRPETIEETAELVTHLGGRGITAAVDHLEPDQVKCLSEK